jgi:hypothetical protein
MHLQAEGVTFLGLKVNMLVHHFSFFPNESVKDRARKTAVKSVGRKNVRSGL